MFAVFQVKGQKPSAPTRGASPGEEGGEDEDEDDDGDGDGDGGGGVNVADLVPRTDIR